MRVSVLEAMGAISRAGAWSTWAPRRSSAAMRSPLRRSDVTAIRKAGQLLRAEVSANGSARGP